MAGETPITIVGNVGADPELRFVKEGTAVATIRVAVDERKQVDGEWQTVRTNWFRVTGWRNVANMMGEHVNKGTRVIVTGRLTFSEYEKDGQNKLVPEITAEAVGIIPVVPTSKPKPTKSEEEPW